MLKPNPLSVAAQKPLSTVLWNCWPVHTLSVLKSFWLSPVLRLKCNKQEIENCLRPNLKAWPNPMLKLDFERSILLVFNESLTLKIPVLREAAVVITPLWVPACCPRMTRKRKMLESWPKIKNQWIRLVARPKRSGPKANSGSSSTL